MSLLNFNKQPFNAQNNPKLVILNGYQLPWDTVISIDNEKEIAVSQILDGVAVFERILRKPAEINIDCSAAELLNNLKPTFMQTVTGGGKVSLQQQTNTANFVSLADQWTDPPYQEFPQWQLRFMYQNMFLPNQVQDITSTQLNDLGITQVIVKKISMMPKVGSLVVNVRFQCLENFVGTSSLGSSLFVK